jgi:hypothetical protein
VSELGASFAFPFRHPAWLGWILVGAALEIVPLLLALPTILSLLHFWHRPRFSQLALLPVAIIIGLACRFLVLGYLRRTAKGILDGTGGGLPAWDRPGEDIVEGLGLWLVSLALCLPALGVTAGLTILVIALTSPAMAWLPIVLVGTPAALVTLLYLPAGLLATVAEDRLVAAFGFDRVTGIIGLAFGPYALAFLIAIGAEIVAQFGLLVCCVGIFATRFAAHCVAVHAFAVAYRQGASPAPTAPGTPPVVPA